MISSSLLPIGAFLAVLVCLPFVVRWFKQRSGKGGAVEGGQSRIISVVAVGPHQRVVTVEVGPEGARVWMALGVTAQSVACLHSAPVLMPHKEDVRG